MLQRAAFQNMDLPSDMAARDPPSVQGPPDSSADKRPRRSASAAAPASRKGRSRLLPRSYFLELARREQLRALRLSSHVSLVILTADSGGKAALVRLHRLARVVEGLIRETDIIGWWDEGAIAVLLADTDEKGAQDCARRILENAASRQVAVKVLAYPELGLRIAQAPAPVGSAPDQPLLTEPARHSRLAVAIKRLIDIVGSVLALAVLSPLMLATALAVKATSKGPVIYKQIRLGYGGVPFVFYKFRSMRTDAEDTIHRSYVSNFIKQGSEEGNNGDSGTPFFKIKDDPRVTPIGAFIRRFSIDELPQLYNVLKGDMSLVGPRPPIPYEVEAYRTWHLRRILEVKPGLTGLWQVEGRSQVSFDDMVRLDLRYAQNWSLLLDLKILLKTVKVVLQGRGSV